MKFFSRITTLLSDAAMLKAYIHWFITRTFFRSSPRIKLTDVISIGEWMSFSEYWSFRELIPESERLLVQRSLVNRSIASSVAIDLGANVGIFTCLMASMGCSVHTFEPIAETFIRLKRNVKFNSLLGMVDMNCLAIGKQQGLVRFQVQENSPATNRIAPAGCGLGGELIAVISLDEYCIEQNIEHIAFMKIDVEGMEPYVLQGAKALLAGKKIAVILIEICPVNLLAAGFYCADLYHEFEVAGYSPYLLNGDGTQGNILSLKEIEEMSLANVVLLPKN